MFSMTDSSRARDLDSRVRGDLVDSFEEELEMEIDGPPRQVDCPVRGPSAATKY
jgi:hypothetical protein